MKEDLRTIRQALECGNPHCIGGAYPTMPDGEPEQCRICWDNNSALSALARIEEQIEQEAPKVLTEEQAMLIAHEWGAEMGHVKEFMEWAVPRINKAIGGVVPVVTHMQMDPSASAETKEAVADVIKAAYAYKPAPTKLTPEQVERVIGVVEPWNHYCKVTDDDPDGYNDLRTRLTKLNA